MCLEPWPTEMSGPLCPARSLTGGGHSVECRGTKLVITSPLLLVRQDVVRVLDFLEPGLGRLVARIDVGMILRASAR